MNLDDSEVDCVLRINPEKGFSSWHIQWAVGTLKKIKTRKCSREFSIKSGHYSFDGYLMAEHDHSLEIELHRRKDSADKQIGFVLRFGISTKNNDTVLFSNDSRYYVFRKDDDYPLAYLDPENVKPDDDLIVHCWIDVPETDAAPNKRRLDVDDDVDDVDQVYGSGPPRGFEKLSTDFSQLFKGVCGDGGGDLFSSLSDVILQITDRKFFCHRIVLAARSFVFLRMFANKEWKESGDGERIVDITDIEADTMEIVLQYIYLGNIPYETIPDEDEQDATMEYYGKIIYAADKYNLQELKEWCMARLILTNVKGDKAIIDQFGLAELYQLPILKAVCVASLSSDIHFLENEEMREKMPKELLKAVLVDASRRRFKTTEIEVRDCI